MNKLSGLCLSLLLVLVWHSPAHAFRNCDPSQDSEAFRGSSHYFIGELEFNENGGSTSGTETHFNYSNLDPSGVVECHITYEITGVYDLAGALFLLDASRSGQSQGCDSEFVEQNYPETVSYSLQVRFLDGGAIEVSRADSGERIGIGNWNTGSLSYKTQEICELN